MKNEPLVSVIIPNYNYAHYLEERMDSVLNQTFQDFEIIILDDASTDGSIKVLEKYKSHPKIASVVINGSNSGSPFKQWKKGIQLARGKYIWIAEADDVADLSFLETTVRLAETYPDTAICHVGFGIIDSYSNPIKKDLNKWGHRTRKGYAMFNGVDYAKHNLYWHNCIYNASGVLFRREYAIRNMNSTCWEMRYSGDWLFWFEMSLQGSVIEVYRILNKFRRHEKSVTSSGNQLGDGLKEDMQISKYMAETLGGLSRYKRCIRNAVFYKKIKRMPCSKALKQELYSYLKRILNVGRKDFFFERLNKYFSFVCPFLLIKERDRL